MSTLMYLVKLFKPKRIRKAYIKKIAKRGKINVWEVDGAWIRDNLEIEFTNFGHHYRFDFIPEYEFWLDRECVPNERKFFIDHLLVEWKNMRNGISFEKASDLAESKEQRERQKYKANKKILNKPIGDQYNEVHRKLVIELPEYKVWIVSGNLVRTLFDVNFTEGGHSRVYDYVPEKEIWLDDDLVEEERKYVLLHEIFEYVQMGKGLDYENAHKNASKLEWQARHNDKILKKEMKKYGLMNLRP